MKDYSFYIIIAYSFCFLSLIILTILSKVFLSDSKKVSMKSRKMTKRRNKIYRIISLLLVISISLFLIIYALRDNVIFFYSPSEVIEKVSNKEITDGSLIRLGGLVLENSFSRNENKQVFFIITDNKKKFLFCTLVFCQIFLRRVRE